MHDTRLHNKPDQVCHQLQWYAPVQQAKSVIDIRTIMCLVWGIQSTIIVLVAENLQLLYQNKLLWKTIN